MKLKLRFPLVTVMLLIPLAVQGSKGVRAILSVSHLTQQGKETRETRIHVMLDHSYYVEVVNRTQPSGRLNCRQFLGVLCDDSFQRIRSLADSPTFQRLRTPQAFVQVSSNGDTWYVAVHRKETQFLVFRSRASRPPKSLIVWFDETKNLKRPHSLPVRSDDQCSLFSESEEEAEA
jgi:hypothetical protein